VSIATAVGFLSFQAQARCHRIGQSKSVKIYRLITRNSYEREMFDKASLKLGLDKAVLQSMSGRENATNGVRWHCPGCTFSLLSTCSQPIVRNLLASGFCCFLEMRPHYEPLLVWNLQIHLFLPPGFWV